MHGLRRTNEDKRRAVMTLLQDEEWRKWSDKKIADATGTSHPFVGSLRASCNGYKMESRFAERNGTVYEMQTGNIGRAVAEIGTDGDPSHQAGPSAIIPPARRCEASTLQRFNLSTLGN